MRIQLYMTTLRVIYHYYLIKTTPRHVHDNSMRHLSFPTRKSQTATQHGGLFQSDISTLSTLCVRLKCKAQRSVLSFTHQLHVKF